jgi:hypothetical protein
MIEREAVGDAPAAVVPDDREPLVPELAHERHALGGHRALRVVRAVGSGRRRVARAVALEVGHDDGEALRPLGCEVPPDEVRLRVAVQEQHGGPPARRVHAEHHTRGGDARRREAADHRITLRRAS